MSNNELGNLKGPHHLPLRGFFAPIPAGLILSNADTTTTTTTTTSIDSSKSPEVNTIATSSQKSSIRSSSTNNSNVSKSKPTIITSSSIEYTMSTNVLSFSTTSPTTATTSLIPPLIVNDPSFHDKSSMNKTHPNGTCWIAPLLGVLGTLGVVAIAIIYLIGRNKKKNAVCDHDESLKGSGKYDPSSSIPTIVPPAIISESGKALPKSYQSWASLSTINTSVPTHEQEKNHIITHHEQHTLPPPPAYTSIRQKRLTADTLVDDKHITMMLKNQYSPQLAFSPSLVAGEFQQQQLEERPPLPITTISPSNTLIDGYGILSDNDNSQQTKPKKHYFSFDQRPIKIEMYEPQVNLNDDDSPFNLYSYSNDEQDDSKPAEHHIVNINHKQ